MGAAVEVRLTKRDDARRSSYRRRRTTSAAFASSRASLRSFFQLPRTPFIVAEAPGGWLAKRGWAAAFQSFVDSSTMRISSARSLWTPSCIAGERARAASEKIILRG